MGEAAQARPRVFGVSYRELQTWSVAAQFAVNWNWPNEVIKPLSSILHRRTEAALESLTPESFATLLTIRFDGSIEPREPVQIKDVKGKLFRVYPGDVIFSKIDVRNGAIGLAPDDIDAMCATSEFPIYSVNIEKAHPEYVKLLFRTAAFKKLLNSMISGASGRKRIQPSQLEGVKVPIPPPPIQQKIVDHWEEAQAEIESTAQEIQKIEQNLEVDLLSKVGIKVPPVAPQAGPFSIRFSQNERWDTFFFRKDFVSLEKQISSTAHIRLGDALHFVSRNWKEEDFASGEFDYIEISSVNKIDGIASTKRMKVKEAPSRATTLVKEGDLIISTTRPYLGAFAIVEKQYDGCVCSSGFALSDSVKTNKITKEYVLFFLKSPAGLRQVERRMSGGLYPAIVQSELEKVLLPLPSQEIQREVVNEYQASIAEIKRLHRESVKRKDEALDQVEKMILGTHPVEAN